MTFGLPARSPLQAQAFSPIPALTLSPVQSPQIPRQLPSYGDLNESVKAAQAINLLQAPQQQVSPPTIKRYTSVESETLRIAEAKQYKPAAAAPAISAPPMRHFSGSSAAPADGEETPEVFAPGSRVFTTPSPSPSSKTKPAVFVQKIKKTASAFENAIDRNLDLAKKNLDPQKSDQWQKERDRIISKELNESEDNETFNARLNALAEMEQTLGPSAPEWSKVRDLDLTEWSLDTFAKKIVRLEGIQSLSLGGQVSAKALRTLATLPCLRTLSLDQPNRKKSWEELSSFALTNLIISNSESGFESENAEHFPSTLQSLTLIKCKSITRDIFSHLGHLKNLNSLTINECPISIRCDLSPLLVLTNLRDFTLVTPQHFSYWLGSAQTTQIAQHRTLEHLNLGIFSELSDEDRANLQKMPTLKRLTLHVYDGPHNFSDKTTESWQKHPQQGWLKG